MRLETVLLFLILCPWLAIAGTITIIESQSTTAVITSSTAPQVTVNLGGQTAVTTPDAGTSTIFSPGQQYYNYPDATVLKATDRMLIYQADSGSKNLTGAGLNNIISQVAWDPRYPKTFQAVSSSTITNQLVYAVRDRKGIIRRMQWEGGQQFQGVPGYNHTYVFPFNNMTNVSRTTPLVVGSYWLTRGVIGQGITISNGADIVVKALRYFGKVAGLPNFEILDENNPNQQPLDAWYWGNRATTLLAANTTYTIRSDMPVRWGGTNGLFSAGMNPCTYTLKNTSSAKVMTNYSGSLCRSTFRTGSI